MNSSNTNVGGWDQCAMRTFMANRIYDAFPIAWKAMLKKVQVNASAGNQSTEIVISEDYVYLACTTEMDGNQNSPYVNECIARISWYTSNMVRCKFRDQIIPDDATYYTDSSDPTTVSTATVKKGDVWYKSNIGYYYIPPELASLHWYYNDGNLTAADGGLWLCAQVWWLRSPNATSTTHFWIVNYNGNLGSYTASLAYGVVPGFSI